MMGANSMRYFISSLGKVAVTSVGCTWVRSNFLSLIVISMFGGGGSDGSLAVGWLYGSWAPARWGPWVGRHVIGVGGGSITRIFLTPCLSPCVPTALIIGC